MAKWVSALPREMGSKPVAADPAQTEAIKLVTAALTRLGYDDWEPASPETITKVATELIGHIGRLSKRGRERDTVGASMLWAWADLAERFGIIPSASYKPQKGRRDTPFLRWLKGIASLMPERVGRAFAKGLEERAKDVLLLRQETGIRNNFDEIEF